MNKTYVKNLFHELNDTFFAGALTMPTFVKYKGTLNQFWLFADEDSEDGAYIEGTLYYRAKLKGHRLRSTIAHELIHHYQYSILKLQEVDGLTEDDWHGETFKPFADLMIAEGYDI